MTNSTLNDQLLAHEGTAVPGTLDTHRAIPLGKPDGPRAGVVGDPVLELLTPIADPEAKSESDPEALPVIRAEYGAFTLHFRADKCVKVDGDQVQWQEDHRMHVLKDFGQSFSNGLNHFLIERVRLNAAMTQLNLRMAAAQRGEYHNQSSHLGEYSGDGEPWAKHVYRVFQHCPVGSGLPDSGGDEITGFIETYEAALRELYSAAVNMADWVEQIDVNGQSYTPGMLQGLMLSMYVDLKIREAGGIWEGFLERRAPGEGEFDTIMSLF